jgi:hypothetical protein
MLAYNFNNGTLSITDSDKTNITREDIENILLNNNIKLVHTVELISKSIKRIENSAFFYMGIKNFNCYNDTNLEYIGKNAFANNNINIIDLSSSIEYVDDNAFANNNILNIFNHKNFNTIKFGKNVFNNNKINIEYNITEINKNKGDIKQPKIINLFNDKNKIIEIFGNQTIE